MFREALSYCGMPCDKETLEVLLEKKLQIHVEIADKIELTEGAQELLDYLRLKIRMALATMSNRLSQMSLLSP